MKKLRLLAVGLLCATIIVPLSTQAIENGIYTVEGGSKTVIWHDDTWGDINMTIEEDVMLNFYNGYFWGFNYITDNFFYDGEGTYDKNNARGGGGDNVNNGFNSGLTPARQGPCSDGRHVPSRGEWNNLAIARCNLDTGCNAWYSDEASGGVTGDLIKYNSWTESNKLVYLNRTGLGNRFKDSLGILNNKYWTSTPESDYDIATSFSITSDEIKMDSNYRDSTYRIRCFKNSIIEPPTTYTVTFLNDGVEMASGSVISGSLRNEEIPSVIKEGYNFDYRYLEGAEDTGFNFSGTAITGNISLYAKWTPVEYAITYELDGGTNSENNTGKYTIETPDITLENPTKDGYNFDGWFLDTGFTTQITEITQWSTGNIILYAKWTKIETKPSGGSSSGGGGRSKTSNDSQISPDPSLSRGEEDSSLIKEGDREAVEDLDNNTPIDSSANASEGQNYSQEFQQAYEFANEKGITTMPTINDANMNGKLTRIAMAKMLSYYAINVLGQKPDETRINKFNDITEKLDAQYDSGVTLAYQLGVMGINMPDNKFRPNDEVTRAEFGTALSRMLYGIADGKDKYYLPHLQKLLEEKIITKDDPTMKELRGYVMIMLMRSAK